MYLKIYQSKYRTQFSQFFKNNYRNSVTNSMKTYHAVHLQANWETWRDKSWIADKPYLQNEKTKIKMDLKIKQAEINKDPNNTILTDEKRNLLINEMKVMQRFLPNKTKMIWSDYKSEKNCSARLQRRLLHQKWYLQKHLNWEDSFMHKMEKQHGLEGNPM